jgi:hypothetical protein
MYWELLLALFDSISLVYFLHALLSFAHLTKYAPYLDMTIVYLLTCFSPKLAASIYFIYVAHISRQNRILQLEYEDLWD